MYQEDKYPPESKLTKVVLPLKIERIPETFYSKGSHLSSDMRKTTLCFLIPGLFELATRLVHQVKSLEKEVFYQISLLWRLHLQPWKTRYWNKLETDLSGQQIPQWSLQNLNLLFQAQYCIKISWTHFYPACSWEFLRDLMIFVMGRNVFLCRMKASPSVYDTWRCVASEQLPRDVWKPIE